MEVQILGFIPSIICVVLSGVLCYKDKQGWGWFLFAAFLLAGIGLPK